jgi:hypothetical protein
MSRRSRSSAAGVLDVHAWVPVCLVGYCLFGGTLLGTEGLPSGPIRPMEVWIEQKGIPTELAALLRLLPHLRPL